MAQRFRVTPSEMRRKADELETLNNKFKAEVTNLKSDNTVLGRQWEGDARNKFNQEFLKDAQKFDEFSKGFRNLLSCFAGMRMNMTR